MRQLDKIQVSEERKQKLYEQVITKKARETKPLLVLKVAMSLMLIVVMGGIFFLQSPQKDNGLILSAVAMETEESLILNLNSENKVVSVEVVSDSESSLNQVVNVDGMHVQQAILAILDLPAYQDSMQGSILEVSVYSDDQNIEKELTSQINDVVYSRMQKEDCHIQQVNKAAFEQAKQHHMGVNKYMKIQSIVEVDDTYTLEELKQCSQDELNRIEKECGKNGNGHRRGCE